MLVKTALVALLLCIFCHRAFAFHPTNEPSFKEVSDRLARTTRDNRLELRHCSWYECWQHNHESWYRASANDDEAIVTFMCLDNVVYDVFVIRIMSDGALYVGDGDLGRKGAMELSRCLVMEFQAAL